MAGTRLSPMVVIAYILKIKNVATRLKPHNALELSTFVTLPILFLKLKFDNLKNISHIYFR